MSDQTTAAAKSDAEPKPLRHVHEDARRYEQLRETLQHFRDEDEHQRALERFETELHKSRVAAEARYRSAN